MFTPLSERLLGAKYAPLATHDSEASTEETPQRIPKGRSFYNMFFGLFIGSLLLNGYLLYTHNWTGRMALNQFPQLTYSPAEDHIEYTLQKFTRGLAYEIPIYEQPPSPEVDKAWDGLHMWAASKVPASVAKKLPNATWSIPDLEGYFLTSLDVFHQLHCLDVIRQAVHPDDYPEMRNLSRIHLRHCIGAIRQSLMCSSDITPVVWQWNETLQIADQRDDIVHTCRNFDKIHEWGKNNFYGDLVDFGTHVEWDINA